MRQIEGWLLQVYPDEQNKNGLVVWLIGMDGTRERFHLKLTLTFYATGNFPRLRSLWRFLRRQPIPVTLAREEQRELFAGNIPVLAITVDVTQQKKLFRQILRTFPDLTYYNADILPTHQLAAHYAIFPLGYCQLTVDDDSEIVDIQSLDNPWEIVYQTPPLRILTIQPECDPARQEPAYLDIEADKPARFPLTPLPHFLLRFHALLNRFDPDLIVTAHGDDWLFPKLARYCQTAGISYFNPNRDKWRQPLVKKELTYHTYGQILHRKQQTLLYGRLHIDRLNLTQIYESGLAGIFEQVRLTAMPLQEMARRSPGAGFSAMQVVTALKEKILIPYRKAQAEKPKNASQLRRADQGGLIGQPEVGIHYSVIEFDFISMYPAIITLFNISPETIFQATEDATYVPQLDYPISQTEQGLIPKVLTPLVKKRIQTKALLASLNPRDCRYEQVKRQNNAQKSLQTVAFGYMGHKHFKYSQIELHEAITAYSRQAMLLAKEVIEAAGFEVVHLYVDGIYFKRANQPNEAELDHLLKEITQRTGLPIGNEGVYKWLIFLPSRLDKRASVPNRYFGVFANGELKIRGIEARTRDTPLFIKQAQLAATEALANAGMGEPLERYLPQALAIFRRFVRQLQMGDVSLESLLITQVMTRELAEYKASTRVARAAEQLANAGKPIGKGVRVRYLLTNDQVGVATWDLPNQIRSDLVDIPRYLNLLIRSGHTIFQSFGISENDLRSWLLHDALQLPLPYCRHVSTKLNNIFSAEGICSTKSICKPMNQRH